MEQSFAVEETRRLIIDPVTIVILNNRLILKVKCRLLL